MAHDEPFLAPPTQSRRRPSLPERGRDLKASSQPGYADRGISRNRNRSSSSENGRKRQTRRHDDRRRRSPSTSEDDRPRRRRHHSLSSSEDEKFKRPIRKGRSRSRSRDRRTSRERRAGDKLGERPQKNESVRDRSPDLPRRGESRDRWPKDTTREKRPRDTSRDRMSRDWSKPKVTQMSPKPKETSISRDRSRGRKPKDAQKEPNTKDTLSDRKPRRRSGDRSISSDRDHRKRRDSRSPSPYRLSKRKNRFTSSSRRPRPSPSSSPPRSHRHKRPKPPHSRSPPPLRSRAPLPSQEVSFRGGHNASPGTDAVGPLVDKQKPNFAPTGLLAREANTVAGTAITLKYHEPAEARKPPSSSPWRLFIFKGADMLETIELSTQSCWLLGRAHEVADILLAHPSCSQQHAAIQFRYILKKVENEYGVQQRKGRVKPYIIDLESSNGTFLNGERLEGGRYVEIKDKDLLKFGGSEREYIVMLPPPDKG